jgi:hypothetical protein
MQHQQLFKGCDMENRLSKAELYNNELATQIDKRMTDRRALLVARDELTLKQVSDELLEVVPNERQAVVGKRFANLMEQYLAVEANTWAKREIKKVAAANRELSIVDRCHRYLDGITA